MKSFERDHIKRKRDEHVAAAEAALAANAKLDRGCLGYRQAYADEATAHATLAIYYDNLLR